MFSLCMCTVWYRYLFNKLPYFHVTVSSVPYLFNMLFLCYAGYLNSLQLGVRTRYCLKVKVESSCRGYVFEAPRGHLLELLDRDPVQEGKITDKNRKKVKKIMF